MPLQSRPLDHTDDNTDNPTQCPQPKHRHNAPGVHVEQRLRSQAERRKVNGTGERNRRLLCQRAGDSLSSAGQNVHSGLPQSSPQSSSPHSGHWRAPAESATLPASPAANSPTSAAWPHEGQVCTWSSVELIRTSVMRTRDGGRGAASGRWTPRSACGGPACQGAKRGQRDFGVGGRARATGPRRPPDAAGGVRGRLERGLRARWPRGSRCRRARCATSRQHGAMPHTPQAHRAHDEQQRYTSQQHSSESQRRQEQREHHLSTPT